MNSIGVRLNLLITGGTGFVGQSLIKRLGCQNIYLDSRRDTVAWHKALVDITHVVHHANRAQVMRDHTGGPLAAYRAVNVQGTLTLARQAAIAGVKSFVFMSSMKVNGEVTNHGQPFTDAHIPEPEDAYGVSK